MQNKNRRRDVKCRAVWRGVCMGVVLLFNAYFSCYAEDRNLLDIPFTPETQLKPSDAAIPAYQMPTFTGQDLEWRKMEPAIKPPKRFDADMMVQTINNCYPVEPMHLEVKLQAGATYKPATTGQVIQSLDAQNYYAGVVASMPLWSGVEIDKEQKLAVDRKQETAKTVGTLLTALSTKRRAERMLGLYLSLEKRSQKRVADGVVSVDEQIGFLEKVAAQQGELDAANAQIEGARLNLIHQCRPDMIERVNDFIQQEIM